MSSVEVLLEIKELKAWGKHLNKKTVKKTKFPINEECTSLFS